jgi:ABC-type multidrug transport system fused ATPase/permease subunit
MNQFQVKSQQIDNIGFRRPEQKIRIVQNKSRSNSRKKILDKIQRDKDELNRSIVEFSKCQRELKVINLEEENRLKKMEYQILTEKKNIMDSREEQENKMSYNETTGLFKYKLSPQMAYLLNIFLCIVCAVVVNKYFPGFKTMIKGHSYLFSTNSVMKNLAGLTLVFLFFRIGCLLEICLFCLVSYYLAIY